MTILHFPNVSHHLMNSRKLHTWIMRLQVSEPQTVQIWFVCNHRCQKMGHLESEMSDLDLVKPQMAVCNVVRNHD